jgi:nicotinamide-nucleotide amidase
MRLEILGTGDELVTGQIVDTNGPWLMERITALGLGVARTSAIGDVPAELVTELRAAAARADVVLVTGGLGPTLDDHTVEALCEAFGLAAPIDPAELSRVHARFARMGRTPSPNNDRQARLPTGARSLGNDFGTATAFVLPIGRCELWCFPGVPRELKGLAEAFLFPALLERARASGRFEAYREVRTALLPESQMDERVRPLLAAHPHVRYGTRTTLPENHVKLRASGASEAEAIGRVEALEREVRAALGAWVFGGAGVTHAAATLQALVSARRTVAFAESLTAGLAASTLAEVPGASRALRGGIVAYGVDEKRGLLGVPAELIEREGAVSAEVALAMAEGVRARTGASFGVGLTGWADGGAKDAEAGHVFIAIDGGGAPLVVERKLALGRNEVRRIAAAIGLELVRRRALGLEAP